MMESRRYPWNLHCFFLVSLTSYLQASRYIKPSGYAFLRLSVCVCVCVRACVRVCGEFACLSPESYFSWTLSVHWGVAFHFPKQLFTLRVVHSSLPHLVPSTVATFHANQETYILHGVAYHLFHLHVNIVGFPSSNLHEKSIC